jgi:putative phosphoribosyl transferase
MSNQLTLVRQKGGKMRNNKKQQKHAPVFMERLEHGTAVLRRRMSKPNSTEDLWQEVDEDIPFEPGRLEKSWNRIKYHAGHPRLLQTHDPYFSDRLDAGRQLARALSRYQGEDAVVYAIPRGGVVVGAEVAQDLGLPLDLVIVRKIGHPMQTEYAVGAVTDRGIEVWDTSELGFTSPHWRTMQVNVQKTEGKRQRQLYLGGKEPLSVKDKVAIIVDDGLATGMTMKAAIKAIRQHKPRKVVVGVPTMPREAIEKIIKRVDELVVLHVPGQQFGAVGDYYDYFPQVTDSQVLKTLTKQSVRVVS